MSRKISALLFEPNNDFQQKLLSSLEVLPFKPAVTVAKSESELQKSLADGQFDFAIIDHKSADAKGDKIIDQLKLRKHFPKTKKFLITSIHLNEAGKPTEIGEIPLSFISKPFRPEILESTLISLIELDAPMKDPKWKMDARLLNPFIEALLETCEELGRLNLKKTSVDLRKETDVCDLSATAVFDKGDLFGSFTVSFPEKTFLHYSKKVSKSEDRSIHQKNIHTAEEFLNGCVAKIKIALESKKINVSFRNPLITIGHQHLAPSIQGLQPIVIRFVSDEDLPLQMELSLQKSWP